MTFEYFNKYDIAGMIGCAVTIALMLASTVGLWIAEERARRRSGAGNVTEHE